MNRPRRKLIILGLAIAFAALALYFGLFHAADCLIAGGRWNWGGQFCRLDRLAPASPFGPN